MILIQPIFFKQHGYIAGSGDGIVTANDMPASRLIYLFNANSLRLEQVTRSLANGHYMLSGLDANKRYLLMARDYNKDNEPAVFDYIEPATDLSIKEQQALWASWQS